MLALSIKYRSVLIFALAVFVGLLAIVVAGRPASGAATLPAGFTQSLVATGLSRPTAMEFAPDGRLFVAEQGGTLRVIKAGELLQTPFVNISSKVDSSGERGLLGIAFDPNFSTNNFVYVYYTRKASGATPAQNRVVRFTADGDSAVPGSEKLIFKLNKLSEATNHNGGAIHFGAGGKLYVAVGDNTQADKAQTLGSLFGKMLRINADGSIPRDNPYYKKAKGKNRAILARGLRNPFSFAVQPGTSRIHINDVGAGAFEEINLGERGANYGWPLYEGPESDPKYQDPLFAYAHQGPPETTGCAITGGAFYNPETVQFPSSYVGDYFFADFCNGWIRRLDADGRTVEGFATGAANPVDLKVSDDGSLYYLEAGSGSVYEVRASG